MKSRIALGFLFLTTGCPWPSNPPFKANGAALRSARHLPPQVPWARGAQVLASCGTPRAASVLEAAWRRGDPAEVDAREADCARGR